MDTDSCISVTQQPLTSQNPTQATTLETPSLMAPARFCFLAIIVVVAMAVLPPSHVHGKKDLTVRIVNTHTHIIL
jgi:hypothetical protein